VVVRGAPYSLKSLHLPVKAGTAAKMVDYLQPKALPQIFPGFPEAD
jgi:hypothetical protein